MEITLFLEIILGILCLFGLIAIIIFLKRKNEKEIDINILIKSANNQKEEDLKTLDMNNKIINDIEKKILKCKKKLNLRLFDK